MRHPYTRMRTPNLKLMSCYYRCKSYRTFGCDAKLKLKIKVGSEELDEWMLVGSHTEVCRNKNGIRATNYTSSEDNQAGSNMRDVTEIFKNRLTQLAVDKIWLAPMKIWSMVRDEMVGAEGGGPLTSPLQIWLVLAFVDYWTLSRNNLLHFFVCHIVLCSKNCT